MKTAIVTGGAGFIGSHLCDKLLDNNIKVYAIDNLSTGSLDNLNKASKNSNFIFINQDVTKSIVINDKIDYIFHLASPASVPDYQSKPLETAMVNSIGTYYMLELAKINRARFLFTSTSEVYGDPKEHPQKETYWGNVNPVGKRACYDESKRFGEMLSMNYYWLDKLGIRIVRIFNTYGPRMRPDDGRVISNFINQALRGQKITAYGKGTQTRSFCYISDLVEALYKTMMADDIDGEIINLGNPDEYQISELATMIRSIINPKLEIVYKELPVDDPQRRQPNIEKAKKLINWEPIISLEEGLKKSIDYYQELINQDLKS